jgi:hypothetical protein
MKIKRKVGLAVACQRAGALAFAILLIATGCAPSNKDPTVDFINPYTEGVKAKRLDAVEAGVSTTAQATSTYRLNEVRAGGAIVRKPASSASFKVRGGLVRVQ